MPPNLTPTKKVRIVQWTKAGKSYDWIREHLTGRHDVSDATIWRIKRDYGEKENYYEVGKSSGRPHKLGPRDVRNAVRHLGNRSAQNATDLQRQFLPDANVKTVKREFRAAGLEPHIRRSVPLIT
ncbi:hypothetical protein DFH09DRAFT_923233, partial [Mycena vulgaris]